jgi:hypothetical protein
MSYAELSTLSISRSSTTLLEMAKYLTQKIRKAGVKGDPEVSATTIPPVGEQGYGCFTYTLKL